MPSAPMSVEHPLARLGQRLAETEDPVELRGVAAGAPLRVVEVLAAPGVVGADGLQVAVGVGRDPHVLPRRRDDEVLAALHLVRIEAVAALVEVDEALAGPAAGPAGLVGERAPQSRHAVNLAAVPCRRRHPEGGLHSAPRCGSTAGSRVVRQADQEVVDHAEGLEVVRRRVDLEGINGARGQVVASAAALSDGVWRSAWCHEPPCSYAQGAVGGLVVAGVRRCSAPCRSVTTALLELLWSAGCRRRWRC